MTSSKPQLRSHIKGVIAWGRLTLHMAGVETANRYRWSRVGTLWPTLSFAIYSVSVSVVFSVVFQQELRSYLPYLTTGLACWIFVQSFMVEGVNLLTTYQGYIVNIRLPLGLYPAILVLRSFYTLALQFPVIIVVKIIFGDTFFPGILLLPIALILLMVIGAYLASCFSYIGTLFPDVRHLVPSIATILTLITPILYPVSLLSEFPLLYKANPMYYLVTLVRDPLLGNVPPVSIWVGSLLTLCVLLPVQLMLSRRAGRRVVPLI